MRGTARASPDAVDVLVTLGGVLRKVDARSEHASDVGGALVKAFVDDGVDERRTWTQGRHRYTV